MGRIKSEAGPAGIKRGPKSKKQELVKNGFDGPLTAPWRKTATIFKQPITLVHSTHDGTTEAPLEKIKKYSNMNLEKPLPIFWSKSLEGISAIAPIHKSDKTSKEYLEREDEYVPQRTGLPNCVSSYCNILKDEGSALSLSSALCKPNGPINGVTGQVSLHNPNKRGADNPCYNANPEQPLVVGITKILHEDVVKQEHQVLDMRKRLQELRNSFIIQPSH